MKISETGKSRIHSLVKVEYFLLQTLHSNFGYLFEHDPRYKLLATTFVKILGITLPMLHWRYFGIRITLFWVAQ